MIPRTWSASQQPQGTRLHSYTMHVSRRLHTYHPTRDNVKEIGSPVSSRWGASAAATLSALPTDSCSRSVKMTVSWLPKKQWRAATGYALPALIIHRPVIAMPRPAALRAVTHVLRLRVFLLSGRSETVVQLKVCVHTHTLQMIFITFTGSPLLKACFSSFNVR